VRQYVYSTLLYKTFDNKKPPPYTHVLNDIRGNDYN